MWAANMKHEKVGRMHINKSFMKVVIFALAGTMMIAHGARMMYQGLFQPNSYYPAPTPSSVDFFFDWMTLFIFGVIVLSYTLYAFYKQYWQNAQKNVHV